MTGEVVNLRQARKRKNRAEKEAKAEENRVAFGRTKAEKQASRTAIEKLHKSVDGHLLDRGDDADKTD